MNARNASLASLVALAAVAGPRPVSAHNGFSLPEPHNPAPAITVNGATAEAAWGVGTAAAPSPNTCEELMDPMASPILVFATKDAANHYLALTIPDDSPSAIVSNPDKLFLFFDANHSASANLQGDDVALELPFAAALAADQPLVGALKYTGSAPPWSAGAAIPVTIEARYTRTATAIVVELKIPFAQVSPPAPTDKSAVGFAFVYLNQTALDCEPDGETNAFSVAWPTTLGTPASLPGAVNHPNLWGDLGKDVGTVGFVAPLCCQSADITFSQSGTPMVQPFFPGLPVEIQAEAHGEDHLTQDVNVEIRVHDFGTGGVAVFTGTGVIPAIAAGASSTTPPVTWPAPPAGLHGCIRAEIKPPTAGPEYAIKGGFATAQYNVDVAVMKRGAGMRRMFKAFNPDEKEARKITLLKQEFLPAGLRGLAFELVQPAKPLGPLEAVDVALVGTAAADARTTDVPRQKVHVPPTAGGGQGASDDRRGAVRLAVKPGDRLYLTAVGEVDLDGAGPGPTGGPQGRDVSNEIRGDRFLLPGQKASRFGGALIGSFDGFATSFLVGPRATVTVPGKAQGLWLAVNDVVQGHGDNTGAGFDVETFTLSGAPGALTAERAAKGNGPLPEVTIVATSTEEVRVGDAVYHVINALGGVTYQVLVTEAADGAGGLGGYSLWLLILLLLLIIAFVLWTRRRVA